MALRIDSRSNTIFCCDCNGPVYKRSLAARLTQIRERPQFACAKCHRGFTYEEVHGEVHGKPAQTPSPLIFAMAFVLGGPVLAGPAMMVVTWKWEPFLLLSGGLWWVAAGLLPQSPVVTILSPAVAGLCLWALLNFVVLPNVPLTRWQLVLIATLAGCLISVVVGIPTAWWFESLSGTDAIASFTRSTIAFFTGGLAAVVALVGAVIGGAFGMAVRQLRSNSTFERDARNSGARP
jgi:hypothetical protein